MEQGSDEQNPNEDVHHGKAMEADNRVIPDYPSGLFCFLPLGFELLGHFVRVL
jgi:hypothetical protein